MREGKEAVPSSWHYLEFTNEVQINLNGSETTTNGGGAAEMFARFAGGVSLPRKSHFTSETSFTSLDLECGGWEFICCLRGT